MTLAESHTYDPRCRLSPVLYPKPTPWLEGIPPINAHFFYSSPIPIDDPLTAATMAGSADGKSPKHPIRPFSQGDSNALEKAWIRFANRDDRENHANARGDRSPSPTLAKTISQKLAAIVQSLAAAHAEKHADGGNPVQQETAYGATGGLPSSDPPPCCPALALDVSNELRRAFCAVTRKRWRELDQDRTVREVMARLRHPANTTEGSDSARRRESSAVSSSVSRRGTSAKRKPSSPPSTGDGARGHEETNRGRQLSTSTGAQDLTADDDSRPPSSHMGFSVSLPLSATNLGRPIPIRPPVIDDGISGKPFVRVGTPDTNYSSTPTSLPRFDGNASDGIPAVARGPESSVDQPPRTTEPVPNPPPRSGSAEQELPEIPVGISRLHTVTLPVLQMKPIYWSPLNDIATVLRGTWFYRDTMMPAEPAVANQLEAGYRELRPWTQTWADELRSAVEVGPLGEEKVSHPLWPVSPERASKTKAGVLLEPPISEDPFCAARCFEGEAAAEGTLEPVHSDQEPVAPSALAKRFASYQVIYKNGTSAFLLTPSLKPSAYYGRRPVAKISAGMTVGIPLVRGFDIDAWNRIHGQRLRGASKGTPHSHTVDNLSTGDGVTGCPGCLAEKEQGQVTDLVLVAHGVGQKLAERVESFHFTNAINGLR